VARDERETGDRALLNLGHTFGHALEAVTGFSDRLFHGEGVAIGMVLAAEFSASLGMIPQTDAERVAHHLAEVGLPTHLQDIAGFAQEGLADADALMTLMAQDKKVRRGRLTFAPRRLPLGQLQTRPHAERRRESDASDLDRTKCTEGVLACTPNALEWTQPGDDLDP